MSLKVGIRGPLAEPIECLSAPWSFPVLRSGGYTPHLLSQNIPESMGVKKRIQPSAILRSRLQVVERRFDRHVANDAGQAARKICDFLMGEEFSRDRGGA